MQGRNDELTSSSFFFKLLLVHGRLDNWPTYNGEALRNL
jgi:hypothetical protein